MDYQKLASDHGFRYIKYGYGFAGPLSTTTLALSSFVGVFLGGFISDKWVQKNIKGRVYTSATGLSLIVPALC